MLAVAFINWGRWVAECPRSDCSNAEDVRPPSDRFVCSYCGLAAGLRFPRDVQLIEAALSVRPVPATRNWLPGESVADLIAENREHGVA